jgi:hypothetical protein
MSYFSGDNPGEEAFHSSFKSLKKGTRRAKSGLIAQPPKPKITKTHLIDIISESPYAQVQGLSKQRSISNIKLKSSYKTSSTPLNGSTSTSLLSKNKSQASFSQHPSEMVSNLKQKFLSQNLNSGKNTSKVIEERLLGTLKKIKEKHMGSNRFEAYQLAFEEIIEKDEVYGTLLKKIKEAYEQRMKFEKVDLSKDVIEKLKDEINGLREKLLKNKQQKKFLIKKIEKLAKENVEISRSLEDRESRYMDLQDKLIKLSKIEMEEVPTDENSWKYLVSENQHLIKVCEEMRKDIKHLSRKEKKLVRLVVALKNRGYPVEEVYQQDVHKEKKKRILTCDEPVVDDSENEDLVSGRPVDVKKPEIVPKLNLNELEESQEEESESSYSSESEDQD